MMVLLEMEVIVEVMFVFLSIRLFLELQLGHN